MKFVLLFALSFAAIVIVSCKKDKDKGSSEKTKTELISASVWKYDTAAIDANEDGKTDTPFPSGSIDACEKDNTVTFVSDGTGTADEGPSKCVSTDPQSAPFTWAFSDNESTITITGASGSLFDGGAKVIEITATSMKISKKIEVFSGFNATVIITLKH